MYSVIFPFVVICVLKANHGHDTSHVYPSEVLFLWSSPALHISASVKRRVFGSEHTSIFFFLFCAGSRKRHSCGPVGQSHYRPCHLFEGFGAVASKRDKIPANQVGQPAQLCWNVKRTKLMRTSQIHANSLTGFEAKDYVGHLSTTCQMWVLQMRGGSSGE